MTDEAIWNRLNELKGDPAVQLAPRTVRVYERLWRPFARWCEHHGYTALPATPATVAHFLMEMGAEGKSPHTMKSARNAIASRHKLAGFPSPTTDPRISETLATLSLRHARTGPASKQAVPVRAEHLRKLDAKWKIDDVLEGRVTMARYRRWIADCALLNVMYSGLLRAAEAAALRWSDIRRQDDGKGLVTIRKSKTSHTPEVVAITTTAMNRLIAHAAMEADGQWDMTKADGSKWIRLEVDPEARVFGLKASATVARRVRRAMEGIREGATGHSCRVGAAQDLTIAGVPLQSVQKAGRWKSLAMPSHYCSRVDPKRGAVLVQERLMG